jgi:hypothetical protein
MRITPRTRIGRLLDAHPETAEVTAWYGVDLEDYDPALTLEDLCHYARLDLHEVMDGLSAAVEEDEDDWDGDDETQSEDISGPVDESEPHWRSGPPEDLELDSEDSAGD